MKKVYLVLIAILSLSYIKVNAQVFTQGDVTVMLQPSGSHDTNNCSTMGQLFYNITVNNSFIGDSVKIKEMGSGTFINSAVNSTGQNPWIMMLPVYNGFGFATDDQVSGGVVFFGGTINKVISGTDTVYNIGNGYVIPVPNPCQYANMSGKVYVDYNNDCSYNGSDQPLVGVGVSVAETLNSPAMTSIGYGTTSDGVGNYTVHGLQSWMTSALITIPTNYQFIFPSTFCSPAGYTISSLPQANLDFSLQCTSLMDVQCWAGSAGIVRPNQPFMLYPYVSNTGCNMASGLLKLVLDANVVYNAGLSTNLPTSIVGDTLIWNFTNLTSISNGAYWNSFMSGIYLTPNASVNSGDSLCFRVMATGPAGDVDLANNDYTICLPVVNSFDPNFKEVSPKGIGAAGNIPLATNELTYVVHFQNTGTAPAINISLVDTLNAHIVPNSLRILGSSHTLSPQWLAPNVVRFNFNNINLPDSGMNEPASHGYVRFSVKLNPSLPLGTQITNRAQIYFDSNPAIPTNIVLNTLANIVGIDEIKDDGLVNVYPNPANSSITIETLQVSSIEILNPEGQILKTLTQTETKSSIDVSQLPAGIYFIKATSEKGMVVRKFVKE